MRSERGQSLVEFTMVLPIIVVLALAVTEFSWALLDQHVVTKLSREGSNLISRDTTLESTVTALKTMQTRPVDFASRSTVILSVITRVDTTGASNYDKPILYERYQFGAIPATSTLKTKGNGTFGGAPDYRAANANNDTNLQVTNLPAGLLSLGGTLYVTEIFTTHTPLTPLGSFGLAAPATLQSIAYF